MKALILNSGLGSRMGALTKEHPKCMTEIAPGETIVSRQLRLLSEAGVREVVMTTGVFSEVLRDYCGSLSLPVRITFVNNPLCRETNYIWSIFCAREFLDDDILLLHGDLVFSADVLRDALSSESSCMAVSSSLPLPEKDFKAVLEEKPEGNVSGKLIRKVGIEFFGSAVAAQPLYFLKREGWRKWLDSIAAFCEAGNTKVYAENALNVLDGAAGIRALDVENRLCAEIDNPEDLARVSSLIAPEYLTSGAALRPASSGLSVYCLFCRTQRCTRIARLMEVRGVSRAFSPKILSRQRKEGVNITRERDLLPGYVFLFNEEKLPDFDLFAGVDGIIRRVGRPEQGYELDGPDRDFALALLEKDGSVGAMKLIQVGESVRLEDHLFEGSEGVVTKIDYRKERARVDFRFENSACHAWVALDGIKKKG